MWSISSDNTTNCNNCIDFAVFDKLVGAESQFKTAGYCFYQNIFIFGSMFF